MQKVVGVFYAVGQVGQDIYTFLPISQASEKLGYTDERIRQMILEDKLIAIKKFNRWWVADEVIREFGEIQRQAPP